MSAVARSAREVFKPGAAVPTIVLFTVDHPSTHAMCARFDAATWPRGYSVCKVDLDEEPEARSWFALAEGRPAVAVVLDGAILALEHECTDEACSRLLRTAEALRRRFDDI